MTNLLGRKAANLCEIVNLGLPVPEFFTVTTEACLAYLEGRYLYPEQKKAVKEIPKLKTLEDELTEHIRQLERLTGKEFGNPKNPLLLSVRSGAPVSMPGMMKTVLNVGINDEVCEGLASKYRNKQFAFDTYERFLRYFSSVVYNINGNDFWFPNYPRERKIQRFKEEITYLTSYRYGHEFPDDPMNQLWLSIQAIFRSWESDAAVNYRRINKISGDFGTAATVMRMVFGNLGKNSGTGVVSSRDPATGNPILTGDYLQCAQGEEIVSGKSIPHEISYLRNKSKRLYSQLEKAVGVLERNYKGVQDVEFTIERNKLFILQTRYETLTPEASLRTSLDMHDEGLLTRREALSRIKPESLESRVMLELTDEATVLDKGKPIVPGIAIGRIALSHPRVEAYSISGDKVILVKETLEPEDISVLQRVEGIIARTGGKKSHPAVIATAMNKCYLTATTCQPDFIGGILKIGNKSLREGDSLTLDGYEGRIIKGEVQVKDSNQRPELGVLTKLLGEELSGRRILLLIDCPEDLATIGKYPLIEGARILYRADMDLASKYFEQVRDILMHWRPNREIRLLSEQLAVDYAALLEKENIQGFRLTELTAEDFLALYPLDIKKGMYNTPGFETPGRIKEEIRETTARYKRAISKADMASIYKAQCEALSEAAKIAKMEVDVFLPKCAEVDEKTASQAAQCLNLIHESGDDIIVPYRNQLVECLRRI